MGFIYLYDTCPTCTQSRLDLLLKSIPHILNPYYLRCNNIPCRKRELLRAYTFFSLHKAIPTNIILYIIYLFIIVRLNVTQIYEKLSNTIKYKIAYTTIYGFWIILGIELQHI
jgi:hypothetical protein